MLSDDQKDRLIKRKELKKSKETRQQVYHNDMAIKKMLRRYLNDMRDALLIIREMPREAIEDIIEPGDVKTLFDLLGLVLRTLDVAPVTQETLFSDDPDDRKNALLSIDVLNGCTDMLLNFGPRQSVSDRIHHYRFFNVATSEDHRARLFDALPDMDKKIFARLKTLEEETTAPEE